VVASTALAQSFEAAPADVLCHVTERKREAPGRFHSVTRAAGPNVGNATIQDACGVGPRLAEGLNSANPEVPHDGA